MSGRLHLRWLFAAQAVLLAVAAWRNLHQLNPDAIAYMRIAGYYAAGQWDLAVTGYWGPLLSWLMVPLLKAGVPPLVAARVVMALSGVVFLAGAVAVFRAFRLPRAALLAGAGIALGWSVFWSVRNISPDLLLAGLVGLAVSATVELFLCRGRRWAEAEHAADKRVRLATAAGVWWGVAYLAKAVALPLAALTTAGWAMFALSGRGELRREMAQRLGLVWLCTALVAGPWMAVLSLHYGKFTFSTTGPIAHALAGPGEESRYHPAMVTLHQPDAGRVTQWEEPSRMAYRFWSPFAGAENFRHQLAVMRSNLGVCWDWLNPWRMWFDETEMPTWRRWLGTFDWLGISGLAVLLAGGWVVRSRCRLRRERWCWAVVPVVALGGLYLPFFVMAEDNRYFYPVWPCLWLTARAGLAALPRGEARSLGGRIIAASFAIPSVLLCGAALHGLPNPAAEAAHKLAAQLQADRVAGPFAGSASLPGGRTGLYTVFLLGGRWLGDDPQAGPEQFSKAGAQVVFVRRGSPAFALFATDRGWREWTAAAERSSFIGELMTGRMFLPEPPGSAIRVFVRKSP
ncbi:MAG: hypothetical protein FD161_1 [Limisphaerales bacterium]|nr:MAG: hypothetical protein FD161_1 [Limisphaerales bacterium]KAG0510447.1 MAG: hypothetical protein E1N63_1 [Limisphaerales bacterium]TXT52720.1 MAG: hypothetical protein FD140_263 [Limisphaerales bacterium]